MARNAERIEEFLQRVANKAEWSVKAFLELPKTESWMLATQATLDEKREPGPASPGTRYMQDKCLRACVRRQLADWSRRTAAEVGRLLTAYAADVRLLPQSAGTAEENGKLVFNSALLVWQDCVRALHQRMREIEAQYADRGVSLTVSGPWPPYSFCPPVLDAEHGE